MKNSFFIFLLGIFTVFSAFAQQTSIKGSVKDALTGEYLPDVTITIEDTSQSTTTDASGVFSFTQNVPLGEQVLRLSKSGYLVARFPIVVNEGQTLEIMDMFLKIDVSDTPDLFTITLSDDELNDDDSGADNISGLLASSRDVFQRTAAFEFSSSFFRVRGLDSDNGTVLINGVRMNKAFNGRPQWSNWGGLNDVIRNQELTNGLAASDYTFGGVLGTTNINARASKYRKGGRVTYSSSNRSYTNRVMATYASGLLNNGWAYTVSAGRRWGNEGFNDGTFYDANSLFLSVEKRINAKHSLNFTGMYAPNRRGQSSSNTQEVYDLKGIEYNEFWGWFDGEKRNSRVRRVVEPILMLNHYWNLSENTTLNTNVAYQFGEQGRSRIDFQGSDIVNGFPEGGALNPSPTYYQNLPSYFLRVFPEDPGIAYGAQQDFVNDGQLDWYALYEANVASNNRGENAVYILYEDRSDDKQWTFNSILNSAISENVSLNASLDYRKLHSENFAEVVDLLGSTRGYLDVDGFAETSDEAQNDLNNPNRIVGVGDKYRYHYDILSDEIGGFLQAQFKYNKVDFFVGANLSSTTYQRDGKFRNGGFPEDSFGKSDKLTFTGLGAKAGLTYKISGRHLIDINGGYMQRAPSIRNTFSNSRENKDVVPNITEEKISSIDASYILRTPIVKAKLTGYYTKMQDANEVSFFFADGIGGDTQSFVQEILQGVDKKHMGVELGIDAQVTPTIKLKGVASLGQFTYDNNPNLYLSSEDFDSTRELGVSYLKDYKIAGGPQQAASVGFEYRDPDYWWFGATANFFSHTYVDISPLQRSENFYKDFDGQPFNDYDENIARELLKQEQFDDYMVVNLVGGKSWKIGDYFVGFFASVSNLLDKEYRTGGFEQGRNANYRQLLEDTSSGSRVFGNRYWYGRGTTYFVNVYFRF